MNKTKAIFFSPYSLLWDHVFPEALVAEAYAQAGNELIYLSCDREIQGECIPLNYSGNNHQSSQSVLNSVCKKCQENKNVLVNEFGFNEKKLSQYVTSEERAEIDQKLKDLTRENFLEFKFNGLKIARLAMYELLLEYKKIQLNFTNNEWQRLMKSTRAAMRVAVAAKRIFEIEKPQSILVYNSLYSANSVFCRTAEKMGITVHFLHAGTNLANQLGSIMLGRTFTWQNLKYVTSQWPNYQNVAAPLEHLQLVHNHFRALLKAENIFVYSEALSNIGVDLRSKIGVRADQKLIVACMSSYDERFAVEKVEAFDSTYKLIFPMQVDWMKELINWISNKEDCFLLIRVHPREFPNRRDSVLSEHAKMLQELFSKLPANVKVNWPTDKISIYDLVKEADLFLNAWSSVGKEMALFGVPTVVYSPDLLLYPANLNLVGDKSVADYFEKIEEALKEGWNFEHIRQAYRWFALEFGGSQINISESYQKKKVKHNRSIIEKVAGRIEGRFFRTVKLKEFCRKRMPKLKEQNVIAELLMTGKELPDSSIHRSLPAIPSLEEEKQFILNGLKEVAQIYEGNAPENFYATKLGKNLKALLER